MNYIHSRLLSNFWHDVYLMVYENYRNDIGKDDLITIGHCVFESISEIKKIFPGYNRYIVYQLEPLCDEHWHTKDKIIKNLTGADEVWDYDLQNIDTLKESGISAKYKPFLYTEKLKRLENSEEPDIDVLFYGTLSEKRLKILSDIANTSRLFNLVSIQNIDGPKLDEYISRSKIILDLHTGGDSGIQKQSRIYYALINNKCILSEKSNFNYFGDLIIESETDQLKNNIINIIKNDIWKKYSNTSDKFKKLNKDMSIKKSLDNSNNSNISSLSDTNIELNKNLNDSKVFIITPCTRPFNLEFMSKTIPNECEWIVVLDDKVKNDYDLPNATIIRSGETGFWGNPNRNFGLEYIKENLNPKDNDWIYILDDDNILHPDWWSVIKEEINSKEPIITWGQLWPIGEIRTNPTVVPRNSNIDTSQYMVRWDTSKKIRFENIYEADGIYAESASKIGSVKMLDKYLSYYNYLRSNKTGQGIRTNICMISMFKNESKGILRMLESVYKYIDFYIFQDNGSTDGTPDIVKDFFKDKNIPGFIYEVEEGWVGFGWNRDHLLQRCLSTDHGCDWIMKMDCDEYLEVDDDFDWSPFYNKEIQSFHVTSEVPGCIYYRAWIWNANLPWKFKHDLAHECIYLDNEIGENFERYSLPRGLRMIGTTDGESYTVRTKYISDALKLEEELIREDRMLEDTYHFWYIAKSYMDAFMGDFYPLGKSHSDEFARRSLFYFTEYIKHIFGDKPTSIHEMTYFAKVCIGKIHKYFKEYDLAIKNLKEANDYCPVRNEHIVELSKIYSDIGNWNDMLEETKKLVSPERKIPFPDYYFLLDANIYIDSKNNYVNELHQLAISKTQKKEKTFNMINNNYKKRIFVVDDFYSDPYEVRNLALQQEFHADLNWYKGKRTKEQIIFPGTKESFEKIIGQPINNWTESHAMCGRFQSCTSEDPLVYHWDGQQWAGMVYLTPDAPYVGGTSLFAHKETRIRHEDDEGSEVAFNGGFYDRSKFELVDTVGNVFNRLVIFDARSIHAANEYFGNSLETSRLFHMFFFD